MSEHYINELEQQNELLKEKLCFAERHNEYLKKFCRRYYCVYVKFYDYEDKLMFDEMCATQTMVYTDIQVLLDFVHFVDQYATKKRYKYLIEVTYDNPSGEVAWVGTLSTQNENNNYELVFFTKKFGKTIVKHKWKSIYIALAELRSYFKAKKVSFFQLNK